jgi:RNA polymerase sigma-70 factor (ECF subfamily)
MCESDDNLIQRIRAGDREAEDQLCRNYIDLVSSIFLRVLRNQENAKDGCQDLFFYLLRGGGLGKWHSKGKFRNWLCRVSYNKAIDLYRREKRQIMVSLDTQSPISHSTPEDEAIKRQRLSKIDEVINTFNGKYREAFELRVICDLSYQEIAELLDSSVYSVNNWIYRVKKRLIEELKCF